MTYVCCVNAVDEKKEKTSRKRNLFVVNMLNVLNNARVVKP